MIRAVYFGFLSIKVSIPDRDYRGFRQSPDALAKSKGFVSIPDRDYRGFRPPESGSAV